MKAGKIIAQSISVVAHPLLMILYVLFIYVAVNPYLFPYSGEKTFGALVLVIFFTSIMFPALVVLLFWKTELISSVTMRERTERIGPLIATMILYLWLFLNIRTNSTIPIPFSSFVLGALVSIVMAFFINNFTKISLHGIGVGGLLIGVIYIIITHGRGYAEVPLPNGSTLYLHNLILMSIVVVVTGATLSSRLYLKAHSRQDILGGFVVGCLGQFIAMRVFL